MHGMTWKQEMHVIFDTAWHLVAAGETSTWISCCRTCLFLGGGRRSQKALISFLSSSLTRLKETTRSYCLLFIHMKTTEYSKQWQRNLFISDTKKWDEFWNVRLVKWVPKIKGASAFSLEKHLLCCLVLKSYCEIQGKCCAFLRDSKKDEGWRGGGVFLIDRLLSIALSALTDEDYK